MKRFLNVNQCEAVTKLLQDIFAVMQLYFEISTMVSREKKNEFKNKSK